MKSKRAYPVPKDATLSVVIPVYNAESWIGETLIRLWRSLGQTKWRRIEIIVVDDGSTDNTARVVAGTKIDHKIKLIIQKNTGRFLARKTGLDASSGDYVFFIDSRIFTSLDAFPYLVEQLNNDPKALIWNGHIEVERQGNPYARFWHTVTFIAWRKYMASPKRTHYGLKDYDYYPKGTTAFFAPRDILVKAYAQFKTGYKDLGNANDDSALIRFMVKEHDIYMAPEFSFTYNSRSTLKDFIKHTRHRGVVFIDGFFKPGTRYYYPLIIYLTLMPVVVLAVLIKLSLVLLIIPTMAIIWLLTLVLGVAFYDATAFIMVLPVFIVFYSIGLYKGIYLRGQK